LNQQLLIAEFLATPWALMPERLNAVAAVLARWSNNTPANDEVMQRIAADRSAREARRQSNQGNGGGGIAVLPLLSLIHI
jgi:hypothetical protein